jgi:hypothetical protein
VAKLSDKEQEMYDRLHKKREAPDAPAVSKSISATVDLSDPKSVAAAIKHGFLTQEEADDLEDDDDDKKNGKKGDSTPRRRGYFKDKEEGDE